MSDLTEEELEELISLSKSVDKVGANSLYMSGSYPEELHVDLAEKGLIGMMCVSHEYRVWITGNGWGVLNDSIR